jgi:hypothetical protein
VAPADPWRPAGPAGPCGPIGPIAPAGPAGPTGPCGPIAPVAPAGPAGPADPVAPTGPAGPAGPCGPIAPVAPAGPAGPAGPCGPCGPMGPCGPAAPFPLPLGGSGCRVTRRSLSPLTIFTVLVSGAQLEFGTETVTVCIPRRTPSIRAGVSLLISISSDETCAPEGLDETSKWASCARRLPTLLRKP